MTDKGSPEVSGYQLLGEDIDWRAAFPSKEGNALDQATRDVKKWVAGELLLSYVTHVFRGFSFLESWLLLGTC